MVPPSGPRVLHTVSKHERQVYKKHIALSPITQELHRQNLKVGFQKLTQNLSQNAFKVRSVRCFRSRGLEFSPSGAKPVNAQTKYMLQLGLQIFNAFYI